MHSAMAPNALTEAFNNMGNESVNIEFGRNNIGSVNKSTSQRKAGIAKVAFCTHQEQKTRGLVFFVVSSYHFL